MGGFGLLGGVGGGSTSSCFIFCSLGWFGGIFSILAWDKRIGGGGFKDGGVRIYGFGLELWRWAVVRMMEGWFL